MSKVFKRFLLLLTALLVGSMGFYAITGCGGGTSGSGGDVNDPTLPYVVSVSPANGATDVSITPTIEVMFSEEMDASTISSQSFSLSTYDEVNAMRAIVVDVAASYDSNSKMALFSVSSALAYKTTYIATISGAVKDLEGNGMESDYSWTFTTMEEGGTPPETKIVFTVEPDPDFGTGGKFSHDINGLGKVEYGSNVLIQPDGKILVSSYYGDGANGHDADIEVLRLDEHGVLDPTFDADGIAEIDCNSFWGIQWWLLHGLALQSDGKVLVGGDCGMHATLFRLNADGTPDNTFGAPLGYAQIEHDIAGGNWSAIFSLAMQPDGLGGEKILVGGIANAINGWNVQPVWVLARFNLDGTLDATFGDQGAHPGILIEDWGTVHDDGVREIIVLPDRKIIAYGNASHGAPPPLNVDFGVARYSADGVLDTTFGAGADADGIDGFVNIDFGGMDWSYSIARTADGKLVGGVHVNCCAPTSDFGIFRLTSSGALDPAFGTGGKVQIDFGRSLGDIGNAIVALPDGSVIVGGQVDNGVNVDFGLVMLKPDGTIDTNFGTDGFILTDFYGAGDAILKMKLEDVETNAEGGLTSFKLLAVGAAGHPGEKPDLAVVRYLSVASEIPAE